MFQTFGASGYMPMLATFSRWEEALAYSFIPLFSDNQTNWKETITLKT